MLAWKEESLHRKAPWKYSTMIGIYDLSVHRHLHHPNQWVLTSKMFSLDCLVLSSTEICEAKIEAINIIYDRLQELKEEVTYALDLLKEDGTNDLPKCGPYIYD